MALIMEKIHGGCMNSVSNNKLKETVTKEITKKTNMFEYMKHMNMWAVQIMYMTHTNTTETTQRIRTDLFEKMLAL